MPTVVRGSEQHLDGAAQVWAEATAARDGDPDVAPLEHSRPLVEKVFQHPRAVLVVALDDRERVVAFAVAKPTATGPGDGTCPATAEVQYVAVQPARWGSGLGARMMEFLRVELARADFRHAMLWVYADNRRAASMYQRLGWRRCGDPMPHQRTGKPMHRYHLELSAVRAPAGPA